MIQVPDVPTGPVTRAADTLIDRSALGAVLIIVIFLLVWLFTKFVASQTERVNEKEKAAERLERANAEYSKAQIESTKALEKFAASQTEMAKAVDRNTRATEDLTRALNGIVSQLVGVQPRRPSTGQMAAVRIDPRVERDR